MVEASDLCRTEAEDSDGNARMPRVLIVSDVRVYREAMAALLASRVEIVGTVAKAELAACAVRLCSDVVLIDAKCLSSSAPATASGVALMRKIIAFAVTNTESEILACAEAGIFGFIGDDGSAEDIVAAAVSVARGELPATPRFVGTPIQWVTAILHSHAQDPVAAALSNRELEVSRCLLLGRSNKEIARQLRISTATVKNHVHHILEKLHVHRRAEAVAAMRNLGRLLTIWLCWRLAAGMPCLVG